MGTTVIYLDVLIITNFIIDYFLLLATQKLSKSIVRRRKLLLGALVGSLYSLSILLPTKSTPLVLLYKLFMAATLVLITFGFRSPSYYIRHFLLFFGVNFAFGGAMLAIYTFISPKFLAMHNGQVYFHISALTLLVFTGAIYGGTCLILRFTHRQAPAEKIYHLTLDVDGRQIYLNALLDTGNSLVDVMSGQPIIVASYKKCKDVIPSDLRDIYREMRCDIRSTGQVGVSSWAHRFRIVPYESLGSGGLLPGFKPDSITVEVEKQNRKVQNGIVAVSGKPISNGEFDALLSQAFLEQLLAER